ncbi:MAG: PrpF domain-containing protein [Pseudomonadota bacterium]
MADQTGVPFSVYRGGTSKGIFFLESDIPSAGPDRDRFLLRILGKPDPVEMDGIGGGRIPTSKVGILGPSEKPDVDINYTFAQVEVDQDVVDYKANCGNVSAAVASFAVDRGFVEPRGERVNVRVYNTNTGKTLHITVPVFDGMAAVQGPFSIAGIPGTGARIDLDFRETVGANTGKLLPTGQTADQIEMSDGSIIKVSIVDAAVTIGHVMAQDMGVQGDETPAELQSNSALMERVYELRAKVAEKSGLIKDWRTYDRSSFLPFISILSAARDYMDSNGQPVSGDSIDYLARLMVLDQCHPAYAGTGTCSTGACAALEGTVLNELLGNNVPSEQRIGHPLGAIPVLVERGEGLGDDAFRRLAYARTARRLIEGQAFVPSNYMTDEWDSEMYGAHEPDKVGE